MHRRNLVAIFAFVLFALTGAGGLGLTSARAQSTAPPATGSTPPAEGGELTEITVTAQRRVELEKDVPVSITALSGAQLQDAGITSTQDLTQVVPGLKMDRVGAFTEPAIRGVSTQVTNVGVDPNVAFYIDGVYQPSQVTNTRDLPDVDHIEVDKGPQGTLFGRNVVGGAIQIFTKDPSFTPTGVISAVYGSFDERGVSGFVSGPLYDDKIAGSLSLYYDKDDGYYHDVITNLRTGGKDEVNLRAKLKAQLSDEAQITFTGFYMHLTDASAVIGEPLNGNTVAKGTPGAVIESNPYNVAINVSPLGQRGDLDVKQYGGSLRGSVDYPIGTFTTTLSGTEVYSVVNLSGDFAYTPAGGPYYYQITSEQTYTAEFNFASRKIADWFSFITGIFAYYDDAAYLPLLVTQDLTIPTTDTYALSIYASQDDQSYAGYFEGTAQITPQLTGVLGVRYSWETRSLFGDALFGVELSPPPTNYHYDTNTWHAITPRASLRYAINDATNVYATYSQGFKSGAYNPTTVPFAPPPAQAQPAVNPEKLDAYEVGLKTSFWNRLSLDTAVFYYIYKDEQVNSFVNYNGVPLSVLTNAASAKMYGLDAEARMAWTEQLSTYAGLSYLHARYTNYPDAVINVPIPTGGNSEVTANVSGATMIRSPEWTLNLRADYKVPFTAGHLTLSGNAYYSDKIFFEVSDRVSQPQYVMLGAQADWQVADSGFDVALWGKNLNNRVVIEGAFITENMDGLSYAPPRQVGITARYRF